MYFGTENTFSVEFLLVLLTMPGSAPMNGLDEIPCESVDGAPVNGRHSLDLVWPDQGKRDNLR